MSSQAQPLRQKIAFEPNVPVEVELDGEGQEQSGRGGPEWRYFLKANQIMWVPAEAHAQIVRIQEDGRLTRPVRITKQKTGKQTFWTVEDLTSTHGYGKPLPTQAPPPANTATQQRALPETSGEPFSASLFTCLCAAVRVAKATEEYSQQIGRPVAFDTQDIRSMAATLFIDARGGRA